MTAVASALDLITSEQRRLRTPPNRRDRPSFDDKITSVTYEVSGNEGKDCLHDIKECSIYLHIDLALNCTKKIENTEGCHDSNVLVTFPESSRCWLMTYKVKRPIEDVIS